MNCQAPVYFQIDDFLCFFKTNGMLEILQHFVIAGGQLEIILNCWNLQRNAGDLATMRDATGTMVQLLKTLMIP